MLCTPSVENIVASRGASTYGAGPLFSPARGRRAHEEQIEAKTREGFLPSFGALRRDKTPTAALCFYSALARERMCVVVSNESNPFYVRTGLLFIV